MPAATAKRGRAMPSGCIRWIMSRNRRAYCLKSRRVTAGAPRKAIIRAEETSLTPHCGRGTTLCDEIM